MSLYNYIYIYICILTTIIPVYKPSPLGFSLARLWTFVWPASFGVGHLDTKSSWRCSRSASQPLAPLRSCERHRRLGGVGSLEPWWVDGLKNYHDIILRCPKISPGCLQNPGWWFHSYLARGLSWRIIPMKGADLTDEYFHELAVRNRVISGWSMSIPVF